MIFGAERFIKYLISIFQMIYQATVTFHLRQAIVKVAGQGQIPLNVQQKLLISPARDKLVFITPPETAVCRMYLAPCQFQAISPTHCKLTHYIAYDSKSQKTKEIIQVVTIKSTEQCISEIKARCPARKYKSCLSFTPSEVRHVSILSGESTTQKYRGFINLIVIMFVVLNLRNMFDNFVKYGLRFLKYPRQFMPLSVPAGFVLLLAFVELGYRLNRLRFHHILSDKLVRFLLKLNQVSLLVFVYFYCKKYLLSHPLSGMTLTLCALVFCLKLVSYMQVNTEIFLLLERSAALARSEFNQFVFANHQISEENLKLILQNRKDWQPLVSRQKLAYFIIAPTLCYQLQYPRSPPARVSWLLKRIVQLSIIGAMLLVLWVQYIEPQLQHWFSLSEQQRSSWFQILYRLMRLSIPNTVGWIMAFYALFHLFLNIISEIIRFGDRNFYGDWWNCRNLQEYWKTWNLPVHFFFIRHCYTPMMKRGWSKGAANLFTFILSAIAHEYLVDIPLGVTGLYAFLAMFLQAPAIYVEKLISKALSLHNSQLGNVSFWLFFCFLGQPTCLFIYYSLYMKTHLPV